MQAASDYHDFWPVGVGKKGKKGAQGWPHPHSERQHKQLSIGGEHHIGAFVVTFIMMSKGRMG